MSGAVVFNGIDGGTGSYMLPPMQPEHVSRLARGMAVDMPHLQELRWWWARASEEVYGPKEGVDPRNLAEAGWGVVFAEDADPAIREALSDLLSHRRRQAAGIDERRFRELYGNAGYRPGESKLEFLARHGAGPGPVDPDRLPYYLLIVGDPETIPYRFQYQLDVQYAVGRIHFDRPDDYAAYARSVVAAETEGIAPPRRLAFFATRNPDDRATATSSRELVTPLAERLTSRFGGWEVRAVLGEEATKERLAALLGGRDTPTLLFTASHGVGFQPGDPRQFRRQGALLCQDWPGPRAWRGPIPDEQCLSADDIGAGAGVFGLVAFHFACFGAGTPREDEFAGSLAELAPRGFVAALPKRLLGHERGGALAVVGHVDRAWTFSFVWPGAGGQTEVYESCLARLLDGHPIGSAFEFFNARYAELSSDLTEELDRLRRRGAPDHLALARMWTANNDARGFAVLGDPAVRLPGSGVA